MTPLPVAPARGPCPDLRKKFGDFVFFGLLMRRGVPTALLLLLCATRAAAFRITLPIAMTMPAGVDTSNFVGLPACPRVGLGLAALGRPGYDTY